MTEITIDDLKSLLDGAVRLIDVRERDEYSSGHIPGAINAPLSELADHVEKFRSPDVVYVVCQAGGRSAKACEALEGAGLTGLVNVLGGTGAWKARNFPLEVG
ncbi:MAG: rhodanese-like domain-containing protein [Ilumatobacteraceae bacterium]